MFSQYKGYGAYPPPPEPAPDYPFTRSNKKASLFTSSHQRSLEEGIYYQNDYFCMILI